MYIKVLLAAFYPTARTTTTATMFTKHLAHMVFDIPEAAFVIFFEAKVWGEGLEGVLRGVSKYWYARWAPRFFERVRFHAMLALPKLTGRFSVNELNLLSVRCSIPYLRDNRKRILRRLLSNFHVLLCPTSWMVNTTRFNQASTQGLELQRIWAEHVPSVDLAYLCEADFNILTHQMPLDRTGRLFPKARSISFGWPQDWSSPSKRLKFSEGLYALARKALPSTGLLHLSLDAQIHDMLRILSYAVGCSSMRTLHIGFSTFSDAPPRPEDIVQFATLMKNFAGLHELRLPACFVNRNTVEVLATMKFLRRLDLVSHLSRDDMGEWKPVGNDWSELGPITDSFPSLTHLSLRNILPAQIAQLAESGCPDHWPSTVEISGCISGAHDSSSGSTTYRLALRQVARVCKFVENLHIDVLGLDGDVLWELLNVDLVKKVRLGWSTCGLDLVARSVWPDADVLGMQADFSDSWS